jgi:hypothetical protein
LATVRVGVSLGSFGGVVRGVKRVSVRNVGVVGCNLVVSGFVVSRSFAVMAGGVLVVFGGLFVVLNGVRGHGWLLR